MIFVKYTDYGDRVIMFPIDSIVILDSTDNGTTMIELNNGRQEELMIDIDDFNAKVFSDENMIAEYVCDGN